jgi:hypothetical protein
MFQVPSLSVIPETRESTPEVKTMTALSITQLFNEVSKDLKLPDSIREWYKGSTDYKAVVAECLNRQKCSMTQLMHLAADADLRE